jgi:TfoX/Sxy family transcriptional regulator of competence genes
MSGRSRSEDAAEADAVFRDILASYAGAGAITTKAMFGSVALLADGHLAAFVDRRGRFVAKLPEATRMRLQAAGLAVPMEMAGRPTKEWVAVALSPEADWWALADEAVRFVRDR